MSEDATPADHPAPLVLEGELTTWLSGEGYAVLSIDGHELDHLLRQEYGQPEITEESYVRTYGRVRITVEVME